MSFCSLIKGITQKFAGCVLSQAVFLICLLVVVVVDYFFIFFWGGVLFVCFVLTFHVFGYCITVLQFLLLHLLYAAHEKDYRRGEHCL